MDFCRLETYLSSYGERCAVLALSLWGPRALRACPWSSQTRILLQIHLTDTLGMLSHILEMDHFALVVHEQIQCEWRPHFWGWVLVGGKDVKPWILAVPGSGSHDTHACYVQ